MRFFFPLLRTYCNTDTKLCGQIAHFTCKPHNSDVGEMYKAARLNELNTLWQGKTLMAYTRKYHIHTHINLQVKIWHSHTHKSPWMWKNARKDTSQPTRRYTHTHTDTGKGHQVSPHLQGTTSPSHSPWMHSCVQGFSKLDWSQSIRPQPRLPDLPVHRQTLEGLDLCKAVHHGGPLGFLLSFFFLLKA